MAVDEGSSAGLGAIRASNLGSSASIPIDSSNIGFQLLKKQGWKEGTGLGVSEQGRLEPIETTIKKNKRGLGAEKAKKIVEQSKHKDEDDPESPKIKVKGVSKKIRKIQEFEKKMQEKEFDRDFFRMFWPDNVLTFIDIGSFPCNDKLFLYRVLGSNRSSHIMSNELYFEYIYLCRRAVGSTQYSMPSTV